MKLKTLIALAVSGLFFAPLSYAEGDNAMSGVGSEATAPSDTAPSTQSDVNTNVGSAATDSSTSTSVSTDTSTESSTKDDTATMDDSDY